MLYSGNHCIALANMYEEVFGQPVPETTAREAARNGTHQQMMHSIDVAIQNREPVTDWSRFAKPLSNRAN